jgi:hypothetical protein
MRISQERTAIEFESLPGARVAAGVMSIPTMHIFTTP